jgi:hypothetical protein
MPGGRPSTYTREVADIICERMRSGHTLRQICRDDDMPGRDTVLKWRESFEEFAVQYAHARTALHDHWAEEILDIAEDGSNDWVTVERKGGRIETTLDREHVERSKLRIDTRKWLLSKLEPKKYGERLDVTNSDGSFLAALSKAAGLGALGDVSTGRTDSQTLTH